MKHTLLSLFFVGAFVSGYAQDGNMFFRAAGSPENPKVPMAWNRYYNYSGISDFCKKLAAAHPDLVKVSSIGKSYQGKELWLLTVTDFKKGKHETKPGFYLDGNIHSNEIQGSEFAMYAAWYLAENFKNIEFVRELWPIGCFTLCLLLIQMHAIII